jgi:hypothetical protein
MVFCVVLDTDEQERGVPVYGILKRNSLIYVIFRTRPDWP